jgi:hypothetical protein
LEWLLRDLIGGIRQTLVLREHLWRDRNLLSALRRFSAHVISPSLVIERWGVNAKKVLGDS